MWRQPRGFTLVEVLATLVIWMITITILLPSLVMINQERNSFTLEREARFLLTEELESVRGDGEQLEARILEKHGRQFQIIKKINESFTSICVKYQDYRNREQTKCVYWND